MPSQTKSKLGAMGILQCVLMLESELLCEAKAGIEFSLTSIHVTEMM